MRTSRADDLGGPGVHGKNGVCDVTTADELASLRTAIRLLRYLPDNNSVTAPFAPTSDPVDRFTTEGRPSSAARSIRPRA